MRPIWLFEADVFGTTAEPFKEEVRRQGMICSAMRQSLLASGQPDRIGGRLVAADDCVICFGSFPFIQHVQCQRNWLPGAWCKAEELSYAAGARHLGPFLLNRAHAIVDVNEALARHDELFDRFAEAGRVFVRPDGCQKTFTGRVVAHEEFVAALGPARYASGTRVVVARPRPIEREWRTVIAEGRLLTGGQYYRGGQIELVPDCPAPVRAFVENVLSSVVWRPDELFMIDVGECEDKLAVVEVSGFSNSALYPCDYRIVAETAARLAEAAWSRAR